MLTADGTHLGNDRLAPVRDRGLQVVSTRAAIPPTLLSRAVRVQEVCRDKVMHCGQMQLRPPREMQCLALKRFRISRARLAAQA